MSAQKRGRGRPRREGADEEILSVARAMLSEGGYENLSVDAVAERTGVAKTTIYRRWPSKGALIAALIPPPAPDAHADTLVREAEKLLAPLAEAADDAEILGILRAILGPRRIALSHLLENPAQADEILGALWLRLFIRTSESEA